MLNSVSRLHNYIHNYISNKFKSSLFLVDASMDD